MANGAIEIISIYTCSLLQKRFPNRRAIIGAAFYLPWWVLVLP